MYIQNKYILEDKSDIQVGLGTSQSPNRNQPKFQVSISRPTLDLNPDNPNPNLTFGYEGFGLGYEGFGLVMRDLVWVNPTNIPMFLLKAQTKPKFYLTFNFKAHA
eukprot:TRINITY_DN39894_c0_g1_i3.p1 TRINITY_DN39894_c0_g1~~TRINITY_DN39894_c0_g1_i3.p1  ORF type:complete len:105 (-),score=5.11 TRINITY_DN39894_c0_g1_i3:477-791(-)